MYSATIAREERKSLELFSPTAIAVISFFFGAATGCLLLAYNARQMGREIGGYIAGAVIGLPILIVVYSFLPSFLTLLINIGLIYWLRSLANEQNSDAEVAGHWVSAKNAFIGVVVGVVVVGIMFALIMALQGALAG